MLVRHERVFARNRRRRLMAEVLSGKRQQILTYIAECQRDRGYPPSVREIGQAVGLASSATVHTHLAVLQREGYLVRDPSKPRAIQVRYDPESTMTLAPSAVHHVPLVGDVAAGTGVLAQENVEELLPMPEQFTGSGPTFMLRVRGDSMIDAGIFSGDYVVVRQQPEANNGDVVVAGIPDEEATVKTFSRKGGRVVLTPANAAYQPMVFDGQDVTIFGKVVTIVRTL
jgi:repressor LexA